VQTWQTGQSALVQQALDVMQVPLHGFCPGGQFATHVPLEQV
jgi:hypothetical protein